MPEAGPEPRFLRSRPEFFFLGAEKLRKTQLPEQQYHIEQHHQAKHIETLLGKETTISGSPGSEDTIPDTEEQK